MRSSTSRSSELDENPCWCVSNDPCGMCCVSVTYGLIFFADYGAPVCLAPGATPPCVQPSLPSCYSRAVVCFALLMPWYGVTLQFFLHMFLFLSISLLAVTSHMRCMLTDPGVVPVGFTPSQMLGDDKGGSMPMCSRCNGFKPPRAHHCSQCDRCVMKMDHHCPVRRRTCLEHAGPAAPRSHSGLARARAQWVNNCVGANNQKHFVLFVGYTGLLSGYALLLLGCRTVNSAQNLSSQTGQIGRFRGGGHVDSGNFLMMALLFFEAVLFGLFTLAMFTEQAPCARARSPCHLLASHQCPKSEVCRAIACPLPGRPLTTRAVVDPLVRFLQSCPIRLVLNG